MVLANFELFVLFFFVDNFILIIDISFHSRIPHIITILIAERRPCFILVSCIAIYILHEPVSQRYGRVRCISLCYLVSPKKAQEHVSVQENYSRREAEHWIRIAQHICVEPLELIFILSSVHAPTILAVVLFSL